MSLGLRCPSCQKKLSVPDSARGRRVQCPHCEAVFRYTGQPDLTLGRIRPDVIGPESPVPMPVASEPVIVRPASSEEIDRLLNEAPPRMELDDVDIIEAEGIDIDVVDADLVPEDVDIVEADSAPASPPVELTEDEIAAAFSDAEPIVDEPVEALDPIELEAEAVHEVIQEVAEPSDIIEVEPSEHHDELGMIPPLAAPVAATPAAAVPVAAPVGEVPQVPQAFPAVPVAMAMPVPSTNSPVPIVTAAPVAAPIAAPAPPSRAPAEDEVDLEAIFHEEPTAGAADKDALTTSEQVDAEDLALQAFLEEPTLADTDAPPLGESSVPLTFEEDKDLEAWLQDEPPVHLPEPLVEPASSSAPPTAVDKDVKTEFEIDIPNGAGGIPPAAALPPSPPVPVTEPEIDLAELFADDDVIDAAIEPADEEIEVVDEVFVLEDEPKTPPKK